MINRYLNADPVPWLTDGTDPAATYLTKKDFFETENTGSLYRELESSFLTGKFEGVSSAGILGDQKNPDLLYRGSVWFFYGLLNAVIPPEQILLQIQCLLLKTGAELQWVPSHYV